MTLTEKDVAITVRLPKTVYERVEAVVAKGLYLNESEFVRSAVRDKLEKEGRP